MEFKTIVRGIDDCETNYHNGLKDKGGIFYIYGKYNGKIEPLFVGHSDNLADQIDYCLWEYLNEGRMNYILTYAIIPNKLKRLKAYISLFKQLQPKFEFTSEVDKAMSHIEYSRNRKMQLVEKMGYENVLRKYIRDFEKYKNITNWSDFVTAKDTIKFTEKKINEEIKEKRGIYFIYGREDELLYIGISKNLKYRLLTHRDNNSNTKFISHSFKKVRVFYYFDSIDEICKLETYLINTLMPKCNVGKVYTYINDVFNPKYNSEIKKYTDIKGYIRYLIAREKCNKEYDDEVSKIYKEQIEKRQKELNNIKNRLNIDIQLFKSKNDIHNLILK